MKLSAVVVTRNDDYGGNLNDRATYCLNSLVNTFDEVILVDWNSPDNKPQLWDIQDRIDFKGNLKHIVITPEIASTLTNNDPHAQVCCETLARNIGIRRATGDYIVSTNIDVIAPRRDQLEQTIKNELNDNTFYTISRRYTDWEQIEKFHGGERKYNDWESLRDYIGDDRPLWMQSWINFHKQDAVLNKHGHDWDFHGYISVNPKDTTTVFEQYEIKNKKGQIYIGPGREGYEHYIRVDNPYKGERITIGFDITFESNRDIPNLGLIPLI